MKIPGIPMDGARRTEIYLNQTGRRQLTAAQRRRDRHKQNRAKMREELQALEQLLPPLGA